MEYHGVGLFKRLEDITPDDITYLVNEGVEERQDLEFKQEEYGKTDSQRKERLRDVAALANGGGGYLLLGIEEKDNRASVVSGVPDGNSAGDALRSACLAGIEPRLLGLDYRTVEVTGKQIVVIYVPPPRDSLFAVTYQDNVEFWKRYGIEKGRMRPEEIRLAFLQTTERYERVEELLSKEMERFFSILDEPRMVVSTVPLGSSRELIDPLNQEIRAVLESPPYHRSGGASISTNGIPAKPCLQGIEIEDKNISNGRLELRRNGYFSADFPIPFRSATAETKAYTQGWWLAEFPLASLTTAGMIYRFAGITDSILVSIGIKSANTFIMYKEASDYPWPELWLPSPQSKIMIGPFESPAGQSPTILAGKIAHRLYNAFGEEKCPWVDESGNIVIKRK